MHITRSGDTKKEQYIQMRDYIEDDLTEGYLTTKNLQF